MKKKCFFAWMGSALCLTRAHSLPRPQRGRKMEALKPGLGIFLLIQLMASCSGTGRAVRTLPPEDKQFLSEVRYLISKKERKIFQNTPAAERKQFIEEFWKERDPDPTTEENEFRDEYYLRIEQANHLFREGSSGWLTDRGRIYILLGEPERRDVYPFGYTFYQLPIEIWFYSSFTVIFVDYEREGIYKLEPGSTRMLSVFNSAQMQLKPQGITRNVRLFDFTLTMQNISPGEAKLFTEIPYRVTTLMQNDKTGVYETKIKLTVRISDSKNKIVLEKEELHPVSVDKDKLTQLGKTHTIEFAFQLPPGRYSAQVTLENNADKSHATKEIKFKL
jgi:GWxTD domain-containing protein